ncbi:unnamed protein product, partial [Prorocentrum cordatum]
ALSAEMLDKNVETLKNMNNQAAKYAKWYVKVLDPKVLDYTFTARSEKVAAQKFNCVLVSDAPAQYMLGGVPFSFHYRNAAVEDFEKIAADSAWELRALSFDARAKVLQIALDSKGVVEILMEVAAGASRRAAFDLRGKFLGISTSKQVAKNGNLLKVAEAEFAGAGGGEIVAAAWHKAREYFVCARAGSGVAVPGRSAALENGEVKINIWPGARVGTVGDRGARRPVGAVKRRRDVRGILRQKNWVVKQCIVEVGVAPPGAVVSASAMRMCCGLSAVSGDVALPVPVSRVVE